LGLIHFWPGNAIAVRAKQELPTNEWSQVVVTYDGSSTAAGIQLYLNGVRMETEVVRDNLYKDIVHRKEWNDMEVGKVHLQLAGRLRDSGFKNGLIDDLQIFDECLTAAEVKLITDAPSPQPSPPMGAREKSSGGSTQSAVTTNELLQYFIVRHYAPYK